MFHAYFFRSLLFAVFTSLTVSCGGEQKEQDPAPVTHTVLVEYFADQVPSSLGATVSSRSTLPDGTQPDNIHEVTAISGNRVGSYTANVVEGRDFTVTASYRTLGTAGLPYPYDANFRVQIWVDGKVRRNIGVTGVVSPGNTYPSISYVVRSTEW
ncbi:hypothetical protein [Hymenobacter canadensis]|uniref:Uncharacterized protein n=1 Tax=Hymenobacter canadensis TaxID=2999067 RepID=A0ABY7LUW2_9BACT|nr:hypothetical protein [Hymenobacter canadensis]WBA44180.1 hypothetical protein O3303_20040 [Hymenobacter canadensis]